jgi:hypothetical protein
MRPGPRIVTSASAWMTHCPPPFTIARLVHLHIGAAGRRAVLVLHAFDHARRIVDHAAMLNTIGFSRTIFVVLMTLPSPFFACLRHTRRSAQDRYECAHDVVKRVPRTTAALRRARNHGRTRRKDRRARSRHAESCRCRARPRSHTADPARAMLAYRPVPARQRRTPVPQRSAGWHGSAAFPAMGRAGSPARWSIRARNFRQARAARLWRTGPRHGRRPAPRPLSGSNGGCATARSK